MRHPSGGRGRLNDRVGGPAPQTGRPATDLLRWPLVGRFLKWPHARVALQLPLFLLAGLMIWEGLQGPQLAPRNAATVLTWVHYRGALILLLLVAGNLFCMACPFMLPRAIARAVTRPVRQWPAALRNKWTAVALFALVLFAYERFSLWDSPMLTAALIGTYFAAALVIDATFANASFCKYVCPLGQFNFVASTISPLEIAVADPRVCSTCRTRDCIEGRPGSGRQARRGCELGLFQPQKRGNVDCTFCLDCVHACPHDNVAITTRVPASELWDPTPRSGMGAWADRPDLAALVLVFTFGALVNAFAMVSPAAAVRAWFGAVSGAGGETAFLVALFTVLLVVEPVVLLGVAGWASMRLAGSGGGVAAAGRVVLRFVYAIVPLGVGVWAAHYAFHLAAGLWTAVPVLQDALQVGGVHLLGEPLWHLRGIPAGLVQPLQAGLVTLGVIGSCLVAYRIAERDHAARRWQVFAPWGALSVALGAWALWVMSQPMEMRGLMMMM